MLDAYVNFGQQGQHCSISEVSCLRFIGVVGCLGECLKPKILCDKRRGVGEIKVVVGIDDVLDDLQLGGCGLETAHSGWVGPVLVGWW